MISNVSSHNKEQYTKDWVEILCTLLLVMEFQALIAHAWGFFEGRGRLRMSNVGFLLWKHIAVRIDILHKYVTNKCC